MRFSSRIRFYADGRGSTAILTGLTIFALVGFLALAVDVGSFYYGKEKLQGATDLAALAAAADPTHAQNAAVATLTQNGYSAANLLSVQTGVYTPNPAISPASRFATQNGANVNAVQLATQTTSPMIFGKIFGAALTTAGSTTKSSNVVIGAKAAAAQTSFASFAIGSSLLTINNGVLNAMLGSMLGGNLSLSVMDYQNLANANISLFGFSNALATNANLTAGTYSQLASSNVQLGNVLNAVVNTASATPGMNSGALSALSQIAAAANVNTAMTIAPLLSFGPYAQSTTGGTPIAANMSALGLVSAIAQVANGTNQIQTGLNFNIPGISSANLQIEVGQPPVGTSMVAVGAAGATVYTAQTRVFLNVQLAATGQTALVNVPIYLQVAAGTAQLTAVQCTPGNVQTSTVQLAVTPSVANAWIGNVTMANFTNLGTPLSPTPATLLNLAPIATVTGSATASISNLAPTNETFTYAQIQADTPQNTSTTNYLASLVTSLVGNLQVNLNLLGLGIGLPNGLTGLVTTTVAAAVTPIDQILASVLEGLGINIGNATTWVNGVSCGNSVLVN